MSYYTDLANEILAESSNVQYSTNIPMPHNFGGGGGHFTQASPMRAGEYSNMPGRDHIRQVYNSALGLVNNDRASAPLQQMSNNYANYNGMNQRPPLPNGGGTVFRSQDNLSPGAMR